MFCFVSLGGFEVIMKIAFVGIFRFLATLENPIIFARSTEHISNYFFRHSKLRKLVKTAEKANLAYFVNDFGVRIIERVSLIARTR